MSRSYTESRAAWSAWLHIYSIDHDHPAGFTHQCGHANSLHVDQVNNYDMIGCAGCRSDIKHPEKECTPLYPPSQARTGIPEKVRVLRVLEYTYDSASIAATDMGRWTHSIPHSTGGVRMRSMTMPFGTIDWNGG